MGQGDGVIRGFVLALCCMSVPALAQDFDALMDEGVALRAQAEDHEALDRFERAAERLRGVGYTVVERLQLMEPGRHDEAIIQAVEGRKADLLVMGAYGHSRLRNMLVGSTTTALLRGSTVPVLVVRG